MQKLTLPITVDKSHRMKDSANPRQAHERQSRLLKDAFVDDGVKS